MAKTLPIFKQLSDWGQTLKLITRTCQAMKSTLANETNCFEYNNALA
jgi:hypothetical protein